MRGLIMGASSSPAVLEKPLFQATFLKFEAILDIHENHYSHFMIGSST
jgi:hypothetical protein